MNKKYDGINLYVSKFSLNISEVHPCLQDVQVQLEIPTKCELKLHHIICTVCSISLYLSLFYYTSFTVDAMLFLDMELSIDVYKMVTHNKVRK